MGSLQGIVERHCAGVGSLTPTAACLNPVLFACFLGAVWRSGWLGLGKDPPLVLIPGILGSVLERDGEVLWGSLFALRRFDQLEVCPECVSGIAATKIVDSIQLLGPLRMGQYNILTDVLNNIGYQEGVDLFHFPYDWRKSNFETAELFDHFVENTPKLRDGEFDILAHSMGGVVASIYLHNKGDSARVRKLITMGTPHMGAAKAVMMLFEGWSGLRNFIAGGQEAVSRVVYSFPSVFELLPTYPRCCILGAKGDPDRKLMPDILDESLWQNPQWVWLPTVYRTGPKRQGIDAALRGARRLRQMMSNFRPSGVEVVHVAGDLVETLAQIYFDRNSGRILDSSTFPGDGTVIPVSASNKSTTTAFPSVAVHQTIFDDDHVRVMLKRQLTSPPGVPVRFAGAESARKALTKLGQEVPITSVELSVSKSMFAVGEEITLSFVVLTDLASGDEPKRLLELDLRAWVESGSSTDIVFEIPLRTTAMAGDDGNNAKAVYRGNLRIRNAPGYYKVVVDMKGVGKFNDYIAVFAL